MLVYGDAKRREPTKQAIARLRAMMAGLPSLGPGLDRHADLVACLIEAGELAQGVIDAEFHARGGRDARSAAADAAMRLATSLAAQVAASWESAFRDAGEPADLDLDALEGLVLPQSIELRQPEGFAFYALYPESYLEAARPLAGADWRVLGLRSIGATLAAAVAVGLRTARERPPPLTLRPGGHPYDRHLSLADDIAADPGASYAIVDEGPGRSGSSIAAAARHLEERGVRASAIHLFPGHANGPGPEASPAVQALWSRCPVHVTEFDAWALRGDKPWRRLDGWVADLVGPLTEPLRDLSCGAWRQLRPDSEAEWPPSHPWAERRKFLATGRGGRWHVKFAGLGRRGRETLDRARILAQAGFVPDPVGWRHGFLVERWREDTESLAGLPRQELIEGVGRYIGFRARHFPASPERGASLQTLLDMALCNAVEALGPEAALRFERSRGLDRLQARCRPVETDSRLHAWEWLWTEDGLLKTDALDHHAGHDLVGCQDVAWDAVGAAIEFALSRAEREALFLAIEREAGRRLDEDIVRFLTPCYLAFQLGSYVMAAAAAADQSESTRLGASVARYREALRRELGL